jgi:hypothetical protein
VFDVHQQQLLVLLLVMAAQFDQLLRVVIESARVQPAHQRVLHILAIAADIRDARSRHQATLRPRMTAPDRLVVRIEQIPVRGIELGIFRVGSEQKLLEEPGGVRPMPLRRTGIGHRLRCLVLGRQPSGQSVGRRPNIEELPGQLAGVQTQGHRGPPSGTPSVSRDDGASRVSGGWESRIGCRAYYGTSIAATANLTEE